MTRGRRRARRGWALLVVGLLASTACGRSKATDDASGAGGTGGGAGSGAGAGTAGANVECYPPMTFEVSLAPELSPDWFCSPCGSVSLAFAATGGAFFEPSFLCGATPACDTCRPISCPGIVCDYEPFPPQGVLALHWSGWRNVFGTCGDDTACNGATCVEPGTYRVRVCAARGSPGDFEESACTPSSAAPICAEAEFELPTTETVLVELGGG